MELVIVALSLLWIIAVLVFVHIASEELTIITIAEGSVGCTQWVHLGIFP